MYLKKMPVGDFNHDSVFIYLFILFLLSVLLILLTCPKTTSTQWKHELWLDQVINKKKKK